MTPPPPGDAPVRSMQDIGHPEDYDYAAVSPHILHSWVRDQLIETLRSELARLSRPGRTLRVLEVGAGHGTFTDHLAATGAHVTITEMSSASAARLSARYAANPAIDVRFDESTDMAAIGSETFDVVVVVAVLHHIPDYLAALATWTAHLAPGGTLITLQDPLWYPRRSRWEYVVNRGTHFVWRMFQGNVLEGVKSLVRRNTHRYDESNPRDMVEYHVIRQGCDEQAIAEQLGTPFADVQLVEYWTTQSALFQHLGDRLGWRSTFGVIARDRR